MRSPALLLCLGLAACGNDLTPFSEVQQPRILAMQADPPWIQLGDSTELSALVVSDDPDTQYAWTWCPLTAGSDQGYECAIPQEILQMQLDEQAGGSLIELPDYRLGTSASATFDTDFLGALRDNAEARMQLFNGLCGALDADQLPAFISLPDCSQGTYPITIRLTVTTPEEVLIAIKDVELIFTEQALSNQHNNPELDIDILWAPMINTSSTTVLSTTTPTRLGFDTEYELTLDISTEKLSQLAEPYTFNTADDQVEERTENLVITWLTTAGEIDRTRTSYLEGEIPLENLQKNMWTTPKEADAPGETTLYFVIRDGRGGQSWTQRQIVFPGGS